MSEVVLPDQQWTMIRPLKPFPNFERVYQGKAGSIPIAFPGVLDSFASRGVPGYDPNLIAGMTVPLGARITIWFPATIAGYAINNLYQYQILWRARSIRDFNEGQGSGQATPVQSYSSYHLPTHALGQPEVVAPTLSPTDSRYFLPGAVDTFAFSEGEPDLNSPGTVLLTSQNLVPSLSPFWEPPLTPQGNAAVWQQGVYVGSSHANTGGPSWLTYTTECKADEMTILAYKIPGEESTAPWDFTTEDPGDLAFSNTFGNNNGQNSVSPYSAILVTTGTT